MTVFVDVLFTLKGRRNKDIVGLRMKSLISKETVVSRRISNELIKYKFLPIIRFLLLRQRVNALQLRNLFTVVF